MAFHRNTLLFAVLLPASAPLVHADMFVPSGFEDLAKTQRLWTEVSLYGDSLGLFETDINLETVTFVAPDALIAAIKRRPARAQRKPGVQQQWIRQRMRLYRHPQRGDYLR